MNVQDIRKERIGALGNIVKKKIFRSAAMLSAIMLSASMCLSGCSKQPEPAPTIAESAEESEPVTQESEESKPEEKESLSENKPEESEVEEKEEDFTLTQMDIQKIVNTQAYTYDKPTNQSEIVGVAQKDEIVHVIAQADGTNWFKIEQGGGEDDITVPFIDGAYLSEYTAPEPETSEEKPAETPAETQKPAEQQKPAETQKPAEKPAEKPQQPQPQPQQPQAQQPEAEQPSQFKEGDVICSGTSSDGFSGVLIYGGEY